MKTFFSWIGAIVFLGILISTCGNEEVETEKKTEPKTEQAETKPKTEAKPKEKTAEEKAAEEKAAAEVKRIEEIEIYLNNVLNPLTKFGEATTKFGDQSTKLADNNSLMFNNEWIIDTVASLYEIEQAANELKSVQPTNEQTKAIQDLLNQVADHFLFVTENYPSAIDNRDVTLMQKINGEIVGATEKLAEADLLIMNLSNSIF